MLADDNTFMEGVNRDNTSMEGGNGNSCVFIQVYFTAT